MPVGIIVNSLSIALGGVLGAMAGHKLKEELKGSLELVFGLCSMGMGISSIILMENMPAVIFAVILGTAVGVSIHLGAAINRGGVCMQRAISKVIKNETSGLPEEESISMLVTIIVLFCASGTGIYGPMVSGMSGDHTILISKSILDLFTAAAAAAPERRTEWPPRRHSGSLYAPQPRRQRRAQLQRRRPHKAPQRPVSRRPVRTFPI